MATKREPVAFLGEDYWVVKHTHDVRRAVGLLRAALLADVDHGCPAGECDLHRWDGDRARFVSTGRVCLHKHLRVGRPEQVYVRQHYCLASSYGAVEGWTFAFHEQDHPSRGAFPAVVFR
jgi:hypothetical protein